MNCIYSPRKVKRSSPPLPITTRVCVVHSPAFLAWYPLFWSLTPLNSTTHDSSSLSVLEDRARTSNDTTFLALLRLDFLINPVGCSVAMGVLEHDSVSFVCRHLLLRKNHHLQSPKTGYHQPLPHRRSLSPTIRGLLRSDSSNQLQRQGLSLIHI